MDQRIGRYQILEEIASGGQGAVYRAFDPDSGQIIAVKLLHPTQTGNREYLERFHREASMASSINHPNVVKIFEVGEDDGRHFAAMEYLPESLARVILGAGALPVERAAAFGIQIAEGLSAAHALGIVHRDVKPQNVLIGQDGSAKLTDFGIARAELLPTMTVTGAMMGTPHYMSPEQARGESADERSDVYSLGCVLYQMLTGEVPFKAETPLAVIRQHIEEQPRPVREVRRDVPQELASVVERAMAKAPERRFQTPGELAGLLSEALPAVKRAPWSRQTVPSPAETSTGPAGERAATDMLEPTAPQVEEEVVKGKREPQSLAGFYTTGIGTLVGQSFVETKLAKTIVALYLTICGAGLGVSVGLYSSIWSPGWVVGIALGAIWGTIMAVFFAVLTRGNTTVFRFPIFTAIIGVIVGATGYSWVGGAVVGTVSGPVLGVAIGAANWLSTGTKARQKT